MKNTKRVTNINVRSELSTKNLLSELAASLKVTQADVVEISLKILNDTVHGDFFNKDKLINLLDLYREV